MNDFASTQNSGLLKSDYAPKPEGDSVLKTTLRRKIKRAADRLGIKDQFSEEEKVSLGPREG